MRSFQRTVLVLTLVFLASGTADAAPRARDVWHSYVNDGKRYGYVHTVVTRLPDGNFRITRETRVLIDVLGVNKEEFTDRGEYVVAPDYRPVSFLVEGKRASGYMLTLNAEDAAFEEAKAGFDKLLASFEDLGKE